MDKEDALNGDRVFVQAGNDFSVSAPEHGGAEARIVNAFERTLKGKGNTPADSVGLYPRWERTFKSGVEVVVIRMVGVNEWVGRIIVTETDGHGDLTRQAQGTAAEKVEVEWQMS